MTRTLALLHPHHMDRASAVSQLPTMHAVAVRLRDHGCSDTVIAVALATEPSAVPTIVEVADAKLANLLRHNEAELPPTHR